MFSSDGVSDVDESEGRGVLPGLQLQARARRPLQVVVDGRRDEVVRLQGQQGRRGDLQRRRRSSRRHPCATAGAGEARRSVG